VTENNNISHQQAMLRQQLEQLTIEHSDLNAIIEEMVTNPLTDMIRLQRLKKRKLAIKDEIRSIHQRLLPDIIA
jgi:hypothetical protein|tara:strand:+ start:10135 stop:10356 length:222 start_codon:yes stop_codon:yes gene_type:complete